MHVYLTECLSSETVVLECGVYHFMSQTAKASLLKLVCACHLESCPTVLVIMPGLFIERVTIASAMHFYENQEQKLNF